MKNNIIILLVFLIPLTVFFVLNKISDTNAVLATTQDGFDKAKLIKFYSPMCTECKKVGENLKSAFEDYKDVILYEEVNVSKNDKKTKGQIATYNVTVVPTLIFIDKNGKVVEKTEGGIEEIEITNNLEKIK